MDFRAIFFKQIAFPLKQRFALGGRGEAIACLKARFVLVFRHLLRCFPKQCHCVRRQIGRHLGFISVDSLNEGNRLCRQTQVAPDRLNRPQSAQ